MWRSRLAAALEEVVPLDLGTTNGLKGRYLWVGPGSSELNRQIGEPCALGRLVGEGDEARVFQLVRLRTGFWNEVVKVCKFPPDHPKYKLWAVEVRNESNRYSNLPDIEKSPAWVVSVPGGLVKVQGYVCSGSLGDWESAQKVAPVLEAIQRGDAEAADKLIEELIRTHGRHGLLLEQQAILKAFRGQFEEAKIVFEEAIGAYRAINSFNILIAYINYAKTLMHLYREHFDELPGLMKITLKDGTVLSQQLASVGSQEQLAMDQDYSDQALEVLLESLAVEPCFLPALAMIDRQFLETEPAIRIRVLQAIARIDQRTSHILAKKIEEAQCAMASMEAKSRSVDQTIPPSVLEALKQHESTYEPPVPEGVDQAASRYFAAEYYLSKGFLEKAEEAIAEAVTLAPIEPKYHAFACDVMNAQGRWSESLEKLRELSRTFTDSCAIYEMLGRTCDQLEQHRDSCVAFHKAYSCRDDDGARILARLGNSYRKLGQLSRACDYVNEAIRLIGYEPTISYFKLLILRDGLSRNLIEGDKAIEEADAILDQVGAQVVNSGHHLATAQIALLVGKKTFAIEHLERAVALSPNDEKIREFLKAIRSHSAAAS